MIERGSLPSDPKPPRLNTPKPKNSNLITFFLNFLVEEPVEREIVSGDMETHLTQAPNNNASGSVVFLNNEAPIVQQLNQTGQEVSPARMPGI